MIATFERNPQITILLVNAPTEAADEKEKDDFYCKIQSILEDIPTHNMTTVLGDFNALIRHGSGIASP